MEEFEKTKEGFGAERTAWEADKTALLKKAEEAENKLKPVRDELAGLKQHIIHMTTAIFGKLNIYTSYVLILL